MYKRICIIALSSLLVLTACSANETTKPVKNTTKTEAKTAKKTTITPTKVTVSSLEFSQLKLEAGTNKVFDKEAEKTSDLYVLDLTIKNKAEDDITIAAAHFKALASGGKYVKNYPTLDELGQVIAGEHQVTGKIYFAVPKSEKIEKIIYEDKDRVAYQEWKINK